MEVNCTSRIELGEIDQGTCEKIMQMKSVGYLGNINMYHNAHTYSKESKKDLNYMQHYFFSSGIMMKD